MNLRINWQSAVLSLLKVGGSLIEENSDALFLRAEPPEAIELRNIPETPRLAVTPKDVKVDQKVDLATTDDTIQELRRRLGKELYRMELDLAGGGRINGKPCDCLSGKHHFGLEATVEELLPMEGQRPVYGKILSWLQQHQDEFEPASIAKHPPEHYYALAEDVRSFRKDVIGSEKLSQLVSPEEKKKVIAEAMKALQGG